MLQTVSDKVTDSMFPISIFISEVVTPVCLAFFNKVGSTNLFNSSCLQSWLNWTAMFCFV